MQTLIANWHKQKEPRRTRTDKEPERARIPDNGHIRWHTDIYIYMCTALRRENDFWKIPSWEQFTRNLPENYLIRFSSSPFYSTPAAPRQHPGSTPAAPRQHPGSNLAATRQQPGSNPAAPRQHPGTPAASWQQPGSTPTAPRSKNGFW